MKDAITMNQQQQPTYDHTSNVLEQYLLKYGGSRVLNKYFAIQHVGDSMRWVLKQLKSMKILTSF